MNASTKTLRVELADATQGSWPAASSLSSAPSLPSAWKRILAAAPSLAALVLASTLAWVVLQLNDAWGETGLRFMACLAGTSAFVPLALALRSSSFLALGLRLAVAAVVFALAVTGAPLAPHLVAAAFLLLGISTAIDIWLSR